MNPDIRRAKIIKLLSDIKKPLSGSELSETLNVTRQVIVQDIAILRAKGNQIIATSMGYVLVLHINKSSKKIIASKHSKHEIEDELNTIVDMGGIILDVIVEHSVYGQILANIMVSSRREVKEFISRINKVKTKPLSALTDGIHLHTIEAKNDEIIADIENELLKKGYLLKWKFFLYISDKTHIYTWRYDIKWKIF